MKKTAIEKELKEKYLPLFVSIYQSISEAKKTFNNALKFIKKESQEQGTCKWPENFGDILLEKESTDDDVRKMLLIKRKEGAKDADIRWWWNINDLERRLMEKIDEMGRYATFNQSMDDGMDEDEAAMIVRKKHPMYGDPNDNLHTSDEDRPLPPELINRVTEYLQKMGQIDPTNLINRIDKSSSFNAFIREEIRDGNL